MARIGGSTGELAGEIGRPAGWGRRSRRSSKTTTNRWTRYCLGLITRLLILASHCG